jgi:type I restriction-modification system DNA methylase subunit
MNDLQKKIIKGLDYFTYKRRIPEVFNDAVEYNALVVALSCDINRKLERKNRQHEILSQYDDKTLKSAFKERSDIFKLLIEMPDNFGDYLGEIYMSIGAANKSQQQCFTPFDVSRLVAKLNLINIDKTKEIISINDCCCGSGSLVLAMLEELDAQKINYADRVLVVANDISRNCTNMVYLQLSFAGAAAVVMQQNALTLQILGETFYTPAFILQYGKFSKELKKLSA